MAKKAIPTINLVAYPYKSAKTDSVFSDYVNKNKGNEGVDFLNTMHPYSIIVSKLQHGTPFDPSDISDLEQFRKTIGSDKETHTCNFINNFVQSPSLDLPTLFNKIANSSSYDDFLKSPTITFTSNQKIALPYLFSIIKHFQAPVSYPLNYKQWVNLNEHCKWSTIGNTEYDRLCELYKNIKIPTTDIPRHLYFAAYIEYLAHQLMSIIAPAIKDYSKTALNKLFNTYKKEIDILLAGKSPNPKQSQSTPQVSQPKPPGYQPTLGSTSQSPSHPLNLILYGPPGTGKTYNTLFKALEIIEGKSKVDLEKEKYEDLKGRYDKYKNKGQIVFTTFHQSMSYEDFIEGIKPEPVNDEIIAIHENNVKSATKITQFGDGTTTISNLSRMKYEVKDGIFKQICENAKKITSVNKSEKIDFSKTRVFKLSLGEKGKDADSVFEYCVENEVIALGWGGSKDFRKCKTRADFQALDSSWGAAALEIFKEWMKNGDIVLISDGTKEVKGIAQVIGDYEFKDDPSIDMHQFRKVKWLYTGDNIPITKLYDKNLSQQSIYGFYKEDKKGNVSNRGIKVDVLNEIITGTINEKDQENYVLIIDEINRGNVAQIFGELITLIEPSKRLGKEEAMTATLPYSQKPFGVPNNLYIIGTMNTADRSVEALDTALRRRFSFEEMMPKPEPLKGKTVCGVGLDSLLETINKRIVALKDREHQIGHSYFMDDCLKGTDEKAKKKWLIGVFKDKIIPLLQEYFYGDYKKIYYVLGEEFVKKVSGNKSDVFPVEIDDDFDIDDNIARYEIKSFDENAEIDDKIDIEKAVKSLTKSVNVKKNEKRRDQLKKEGYKDEDIEKILNGESKGKFTPEKTEGVGA